MQTSTIMLDSTLDKILAAKQVESPMQVDSDEEPKKEVSDEAEVRLVVRFVVEEQIVYKGKVQRVHQLESEELSRVVSRVAWDGAKESVKPESEGEDGGAQKDDNVESKERARANNPMVPDTTNESSTIVAFLKDSPGPSEANANPVQEDSTSNNESSTIVALSEGNSGPSEPNANPVQGDSTSNNESSDHLACTKSTPIPTKNKLFAKWSDNHFYPGTILKRANDRKFVIGFFDGARRNVAETDLIPLCNIEGKQVRVSIAKDYCVNAIVHHLQPLVNDQHMFDVEYQQDGLVRKCVPLKDIFLTPEQGTPLINQVDKISGASNFADVDLDNIIYEKRSRRLQEMEDFDLTENSSVNSKRKRGQYNMRNVTPRSRANTPNADCLNSPGQINKRHSQSDISEDPESAGSPDTLKANFPCSNSNPPSEGSSSTGSSNVPNVLELGQEFYFTSSSHHRTKTSLLL